MGADLLVMRVPQFETTDERMSQLRVAVAALTAIPADAVADDDDSPAALPDYKLKLVAAVEVLPSFDQLRDVTPLDRYWITGGMSWGDYPTESMDDFCTLCGCDEIYQLMDQFSMEDELAKVETSDTRYCVMVGEKTMALSSFGEALQRAREMKETYSHDSVQVVIQL